eukprot:CAMPEP_0118969060 /NCGR_PEP_ID=MMETSP1173-20130426/6202_1 /TAXON_ID=1034831 /ORGANISM="Rhizochromulina marina cf, Strain CCMP1243" /LENGTH=94 /DNA_ID=CAMNT_0006918253 /DNA_START=12 /DNA_END=296 /DNA_ORIENTATION=-
MHGFALNVHPDLSAFDHIVPCGIAHKGVTSIRQILEAQGDPGANDVTVHAVADRILRNMESQFQLAIEIANNSPPVDQETVSDSDWLTKNQRKL